MQFNMGGYNTIGIKWFKQQNISNKHGENCTYSYLNL